MTQKKDQITGQRYWRSLDELADTPEFREFLHREFPENASEMTSGVDRRKFLVLMGASIGLAGLAGCRRPIEKILPASTLVDPIVPGEPSFYATIMNFAGQSQGLLVRSNDGRPTKIEGNPLHPASLGAANSYAQASILNLYDPDRTQSVKQGGQKKTWKDFTDFAGPHFTDLRTKQGEGLRILVESNSSPSLRELKDHILKTFPQAKWHTYDVISQDNVNNGAQLAFGQLVHAHYAFDRADVVVALDSDFLGNEPLAVANLKNYAKKRRTGTDIEYTGGHGADSGHPQSASLATHDSGQSEPGRTSPPRDHDTVQQADRSKLNPPATPQPSPTAHPAAPATSAASGAAASHQAASHEGAAQQ
ncbi:MAG TPA: TAT-variant-translocated molybdopterin oxidoreductase, partial [Blastocatellia bacterium]|nr:TAT-variant-translocated molybdopterin oxidoreductase [Blastocatellia bacterium]